MLHVASSILRVSSMNVACLQLHVSNAHALCVISLWNHVEPSVTTNSKQIWKYLYFLYIFQLALSFFEDLVIKKKPTLYLYFARLTACTAKVTHSSTKQHCQTFCISILKTILGQPRHACFPKAFAGLLDPEATISMVRVLIKL